MIITLSGDNDFAIRSFINDAVKRHRNTYGDMTLQRFDEDTELAVIEEAVLAVPFLASQSLIITRGLAQDKSHHDQIIQLIEKVPDTTTLILHEPKLDKRTALYKVLQSRTDFTDFKTLDTAALRDWVVAEFKSRDVEISKDLARSLIERAGEDQWLLSNEIEKLAYSGQSITRGLIEDMVEPHPRETIFQLLDAVAANDQTSAVRLYQKLLAARAEPHYILSMLIWQMTNMTIALHGRDKTDQELIRKFKISPYVLKKSRSAVQRITPRQLGDMWRQVMDIDKTLKTQPVNDELVVEQLVVRMSD